MHQRTPTGGTAGPLSLFVIPRACEGNATSGTDPADTHDAPPPPTSSYHEKLTLVMMVLCCT